MLNSFLIAVLFAKALNYLPTFINPTSRMKVQGLTRSGLALKTDLASGFRSTCKPPAPP